MAQAVSRVPFTMEARVHARASACGGLWWMKWHWGRFLLWVLVSALSVSFHRSSSYSYIILGMVGRPLVAAVQIHILTPSA